MPNPAKIVEELDPVEVFSQFAAITKVPRPTFHEERIGTYLMAFADHNRLSASRDDHGNVLIQKPHSRGNGAAPVILQSHMDMVAAKLPDLPFNFETDPIQPVVDGDRLRAKGTTLGADDGIGMAMALAVLAAKDIPHPPIEALFTTSEEQGMIGALHFDASVLKGEYFINIDSEEEGVFYAGCAGGSTATITLPVETRPAEKEAYSFHEVLVSGLEGGHSGGEIHRQRGNANRLLARTLSDLSQKFGIALADLTGGHADNAIPDRASARVMAKTADTEALRIRLAELRSTLMEELQGAENEEKFQLTLTPADAAPNVFTDAALHNILTAALLFPNGVAAMVLAMKDEPLVETSSNFGMVRHSGDTVVFTVSMRSSLTSKLSLLKEQLRLLTERIGAKIAFKGEYPGWPYQPESKLREVFFATYATLFPNAAAPKVAAIHAGLECGIFAERFRKQGRKVDVISFGPDLRAVHTPDENLGIASTGRGWALLKAVLAQLC